MLWERNAHNIGWLFAYNGMLHTGRADEIDKQQLVNYSNWIFHALTQQDCVGGRKEGNIQCGGMLTYQPCGFKYEGHITMTF
jgi:hypothetical protein